MEIEVKNLTREDLCWWFDFSVFKGTVKHWKKGELPICSVVEKNQDYIGMLLDGKNIHIKLKADRYISNPDLKQYGGKIFEVNQECVKRAILWKIHNTLGYSPFLEFLFYVPPEPLEEHNYDDFIYALIISNNLKPME